MLRPSSLGRPCLGSLLSGCDGGVQEAAQGWCELSSLQHLCQRGHVCRHAPLGCVGDWTALHTVSWRQVLSTDCLARMQMVHALLHVPGTGHKESCSDMACTRVGPAWSMPAIVMTVRA